MTPLVTALLAGLIVSTISLVGIASLALAKKTLERFLLAIVAFAAGGLLGGAFFHLLPESLVLGGPIFPSVLAGIVLFFVLDSVFWIYHCHGGHQVHNDDHHGHGPCPIKPMGWLSLFGDGLHNFLDGIVIGTAFLVNPALGWTTTLAVGLHEIPQEIGDYGILIHSGMSHKRALKWNALTAVTAIFGVALAFFLQTYIEGLVSYVLPFAAGGFIYMACANLLPEIKEESSLKRRALQFVFFLMGLALLWLTREV